MNKNKNDSLSYIQIRLKIDKLSYIHLENYYIKYALTSTTCRITTSSIPLLSGSIFPTFFVKLQILLQRSLEAIK